MSLHDSKYSIKCCSKSSKAARRAAETLSGRLGDFPVPPRLEPFLFSSAPFKQAAGCLTSFYSRAPSLIIPYLSFPQSKYALEALSRCLLTRSLPLYFLSLARAPSPRCVWTRTRFLFLLPAHIPQVHHHSSIQGPRLRQHLQLHINNLPLIWPVRAHSDPWFTNPFISPADCDVGERSAPLRGYFTLPALEPTRCIRSGHSQPAIEAPL